MGLVLTRVLSQAQPEVHTPVPGSAEREAIMDAMRLDFYGGDLTAAHRNAKRILFKVRFLRVHGDWALTNVDPVDATGKEMAEPRWGLLHRKSGQWSDMNYFDALRPFPNEESAAAAMEMTPSTTEKIWRTFPDAPKDIFPAASKQRP